MRVLILGADGYLGWPTSMVFAAKGHDVLCVDNYLRRNIAMQTCSEALLNNPDLHKRSEIFNSITGKKVDVAIGDCTDYRFMEKLFLDFKPEVVVHYAEQPSAPYSMIGFHESSLTLKNNLNATFNLIYAVLEHAPECHIIKLGTMGEYGTPNIDIEEGWIDVNHKGRTQKFLFPRQAGSLYHTTKIMDTDLLWFFVRTYGLRVTDLMQGPVYGLSTDEADLSEKLLPNFHYDDIFGTVLNRFLVQAAAAVPLTVYGKGGQVRGYINLKDTMQCVELAATIPADQGELRILNQFTETFSVNELAAIVQKTGNEMGLNVQIQSIENPRKEAESHYYNPAHSALMDLGWKPHCLTSQIVSEMLQVVIKYKGLIDKSKIMPRVKWG